ncbi:MAG: O-antigen ligase family protein [Sphingomonadales bacterium]|nr:MAG: O-antigen ligase family protein [Sphingomonadales bacterium]
MSSGIKFPVFGDALVAPIGFSRWIGFVGGLILPVIAALLFRTYDLDVTPAALESARHLGLVYLAGEIAVIIIARRRGLNVREILSALPAWAKIALAIFLATFWISSAFVSQMMAFSLGLSLGWIVHLLFAASLYHLARSAPPVDARQLAVGFVAGLVALAVFIALHFAAVPAALFGPYEAVDLGSAIPGFISSRLFGAWCGAVLALLTGIAWQHRGTNGRHALYLMLALAFGLAFWTATRAAMLGWAIGIPVAWLLAGKPASSALYTRLPAYLIAAIVLALLLPPHNHSQFTFFRWDGMPSTDAMMSGRLTIWASALRVAAEYPLLGSGAGSNWWLVPLDGFYHVQPHNAVVQFLLNWGLIPTIPALALLGGAVWHAHRIARRQRQILPMILMLDCLLAMSLLDGMLHFAQFIMLIFGCLALCLATEKLDAADISLSRG